MIKVLLLDDEKLALEYLENIISWETYGFEIVGAMTDAEQALKVFRRTRPDLIISDICMYGMDGLDFASAIRETDQNTHILFLSGYKNFDYVREALRLGTDDYLLKSDVDEEIFLQKILKIKDKIEKEKQKKLYTENVIFKELFLNRTEEKKYRNILSEAEYIRLHKKYYYLLVTQKQAPRFLNEFFNNILESYYLDEERIYELIQGDCMPEEMKMVSGFMVNGNTLVIICEMSQSYVSQKEIYETFYQFASQVYTELNRMDMHGYNVLFYPHGCAVRQFRDLFYLNRAQLDKQVVKPKPYIFEFETGRADQQNISSGTSNFTWKEVYRALSEQKQELIAEYVETLKIAIAQEDYITYLWCLKEILKAMNYIEQKNREMSNGVAFCLASSYMKYDMSDPLRVTEFIEMKIDEIELAYNSHKAGEYSKPIRDTLDYIHQHYGDEEMSMTEVSKSVGLSSSWLSTKFKEEVGIGFIEYLNKVRVNEAKRLIDEGEYMIYEVSEKTGFASSQYFSKIFKQITGLTPNEYKRLSKKSEREQI